MRIRAEQPADIDAIRELTDRAFASEAHSSGTEAAIIDALRGAGALTLSLVAEKDGAILGQVSFSPVTIDGSPGEWVGLGPISVDPNHQRTGIGTALIDAGLAQMKAAGADGCVLVGDPAYYSRFGFLGDCGLTYGDVPPKYVQQRALNGQPATGRVTYSPAFETAAAG